MNSKTKNISRKGEWGAQVPIIFEKLREFYSSLGDTYRVRAYDNALEDPTVMGKSLQLKKKEIEDTGTLKELELIEPYEKLLKVRGIGPKFVKNLMKLQLPRKVLQHPPNLLKVTALKLTDAQKIALVHYKELSSRVKRSTITAYLKKLSSVLPGAIGVGSYRRGLKTSSDIDVLVRKDAMKNLTSISEIPGYLATLMKGKSKISIIAKGANAAIFQVDILQVPEDEYFESLLYFTGSKDFNIKMRAHAKKKGYLLNEHGLYKVLTGKKIAVSSEQEIFDVIGFEWVPPTQR